MESYQNIRVLPDPEFTVDMLMAALFAKLHRALGQHAGGKVGVSFPHAGKTPGDVLRLHGTAEKLQAFSQTLWLKGMSDCVDVSTILDVPADTLFRCVSRVQVKSSAERLRRRSVKKDWLTEEEARIRIPDKKSQKTNLPFIPMKSLSTGALFPLFIEQGELCLEPVPGEFSAYGLSAKATVPWF